MILKEADGRADDIAQLKQLLNEAPAKHHTKIQRQIDNIYAGVAAERDAAHFLGRGFGKSDRIAILHDLRLELDGDAAQIDHLVIHRFQAKAWVLETKNYSGRLTCDEHGDWTVWYGRKPQSIPSPINQARRQCALLQQWFEANGISTIRRIEPVVLIAPTSSVDRSQLTPGTHVVKSDNFAEWWDKQAGEIGVGTALRMFSQHVINGLSEEDLRALGEQLSEAHRPSNYNWASMLRLPQAVISAPGDGSATSQTPSESEPLSKCDFEGNGPWRFATENGEVSITRLPDGRYALRNARDDALIDRVKTACRGKARWNPRYRNWIVPIEELPDIVQQIGGKLMRDAEG